MPTPCRHGARVDGELALNAIARLDPQLIAIGRPERAAPVELHVGVKAQFDDAPVEALQTGHGNSPVEELPSVSRFAPAATPTNRATAHALARTRSVMSPHCESGATAARIHGLIVATSTSPAAVSRTAVRLESNQNFRPQVRFGPRGRKMPCRPPAKKRRLRLAAS